MDEIKELEKTVDEKNKKFPMKWLVLSIFFACLIELIFLGSESIFYQFVILNYKEFCINVLDKIPPIILRVLLIGLSIFWGISWWFAFNSKKEKLWITVLCVVPFLIGILGLSFFGISFFGISFYYSTLVVIAIFFLLIIGLTLLGVPLLF